MRGTGLSGSLALAVVILAVVAAPVAFAQQEAAALSVALPGVLAQSPESAATAVGSPASAASVPKTGFLPRAWRRP